MLPPRFTNQSWKVAVSQSFSRHLTQQKYCESFLHPKYQQQFVLSLGTRYHCWLLCMGGRSQFPATNTLRLTMLIFTACTGHARHVDIPSRWTCSIANRTVHHPDTLCNMPAKKDPRLERAGVSGYNKPKATPNHPTKSHVVVAKEGNHVKLIRFGQQGVKGSPDGSKRNEAFKARHAKNIAKGKMSAAYWADKVKW